MEGKVLITGSNGQLGQCFKYVLKDELNYIFTSREDFDICDESMMRQYLSSHKDIKVIINCAAYTNVAKAEEEREQADLINHKAVADLAELCKEFDIFLIHFGTDYMYDYMYGGVVARDPIPITEKEYDFTEPEDTIFYSNHGQFVNQYGLSKLRGVKKLFDIQPNFVVIIVSWLFSPYGKNFVKTIYNKIINNEQCTVVYTEAGSPTYAIDVVRFIVNEIENNDCKTFMTDEDHIINFSNLGVASWYDLAKAVEHACNVYRSTILPNFIKTKLVAPTVKPFSNILRPRYSVLNTFKMCTSNVGKPYVRHWLDAVEDCVTHIRLNDYTDKLGWKMLVRQ